MNERMKIEVDAMLGDILSCPLNSDAARLYVVMEGIRYIDAEAEGLANIQEFTALYEMGSSPHGPNSFAGCTVFENKVMKLKATGHDPHLVQKAKQLGKILRNIRCEPDEEILLITWDHGSAFGVFRDEDPKIPTAPVRTAITDRLDQHPHLKQFWDKALESDELSKMMERRARGPILLKKAQPVRIPEILKNWELATAVGIWLGKEKKLGVLVMLNCWMMNLHTLYSLRGCVKYLVAPAGNIDSPGYNYHDILLGVYNSKPDPISPKELSVLVVRSSHNDLMAERAKVMNREYPMTLSFRSVVNVRLDYAAPEPNRLDELFATLNELVGMLDELLKNDESGAFLWLMRYVRALSFDFTEGLVGMVDLPNYLFYLIAATNGLPEPAFPKEFIEGVNRLVGVTVQELPVVLPRWIGDNCYVWEHQHIFTKLTNLKPTGFNIFFPVGKQIDPLVLDNVRDDLLMNESFVRWKRLLDKVHGGDPLP